MRALTIATWILAMALNAVGLALNIGGAVRGDRECLFWCTVNAILLMALAMTAPIRF